MTSIAYAAGETAAIPGAGGLMSFLPLILIFMVFYFLLIRPQQKKAKDQQSFIDSLKKGTDVVTNGGIHGKITGLTESVVTLEIAENIRIKVNRGAIMSSAAEAQKQAEGGKKLSSG